MKKNTIFRYCASLALGLALSSNLCASYDVTTVAGVAGSFAHTDGVGSAAQFKSPGMLSIDLSTGDLLIADADDSVRKMTTTGGTYTASTLFYADNVFEGEPLDAICQYIVSGTTTYLTTHQYIDLMQWTQSGGTYVSNTSLDSGEDGYPGSEAWGLVIDSSNNIFMTSSANNRIYKILPNGSYSIFVENSALNGLTGITIDSSNNLYASDTANNTIRKITPAGVVTTIAGTAGTSGSTDAAGSSARFNSPWDIDIDAAGNLYVADRGNNLIRKLTNSSGTYTVSTIAGLAGSTGSADGTGSAARFNAPTGLAVDASGNIFVTDTGNDTIRRLAPPSLTIEVDGAASASHSGAISVGILNKTNAGSLALSSASNAIGNLDIQGGLVSVTSAGNLNGASSAVTFAASGIDPATGFPNTATLEIAGTMNTGALAFTSNGTVQVDGSNVATLNTAPTGTGLAHKTGAGVLKVASDLSASNTLAGIHVDNGTFYVQSGKAPVAPIAVASSAIMELGAGLAASAVGGAVTVASGAEMLVDAGATVPHQNITNTVATTYTFNAATGYFMNGAAQLPWPAQFGAYLGYVAPNAWNPGGYEWSFSAAGGSAATYGNISVNVMPSPQPVYGTGGAAPAPYTQTVTTTTGSDIFTGHLEFVSGSTLKLGNNSTWARNITVGTAS